MRTPQSERIKEKEEKKRTETATLETRPMATNTNHSSSSIPGENEGDVLDCNPPLEPFTPPRSPTASVTNELLRTPSPIPLEEDSNDDNNENREKPSTNNKKHSPLPSSNGTSESGTSTCTYHSVQSPRDPSTPQETPRRSTTPVPSEEPSFLHRSASAGRFDWSEEEVKKPRNKEFTEEEEKLANEGPAALLPRKVVLLDRPILPHKSNAEKTKIFAPNSTLSTTSTKPIGPGPTRTVKTKPTIREQVHALNRQVRNERRTNLESLARYGSDTYLADIAERARDAHFSIGQTNAVDAPRKPSTFAGPPKLLPELPIIPATGYERWHEPPSQQKHSLHQYFPNKEDKEFLDNNDLDTHRTFIRYGSATENVHDVIADSDHPEDLLLSFASTKDSSSGKSLFPVYRNPIPGVFVFYGLIQGERKVVAAPLKELHKFHTCCKCFPSGPTSEKKGSQRKPVQASAPKKSPSPPATKREKSGASSQNNKSKRSSKPAEGKKSVGRNERTPVQHDEKVPASRAERTITQGDNKNPVSTSRNERASTSKDLLRQERIEAARAEFHPRIRLDGRKRRQDERDFEAPPQRSYSSVLAQPVRRSPSRERPFMRRFGPDPTEPYPYARRRFSPSPDRYSDRPSGRDRSPTFNYRAPRPDAHSARPWPENPFFPSGPAWTPDPQLDTRLLQQASQWLRSSLPDPALLAQLSRHNAPSVWMREDLKFPSHHDSPHHQ